MFKFAEFWPANSHDKKMCNQQMINVTLQILLKGWLIMQEFCDHSDCDELYDI